MGTSDTTRLAGLPVDRHRRDTDQTGSLAARPPTPFHTSYEVYIHLYSHKLQLQKQEIKNEKERHEITRCQMHTNCVQQKCKVET